MAGIPGSTYYWVRNRVTSLVGLFVFPFVLFGHFFVFRGPGAGASGHTGVSSRMRGTKCFSVREELRSRVQVDLTACRFSKGATQRNGSERGPCFQRGSRIGTVRIRLGVTSSMSSTPLLGHSTLSHQLVYSCSQVSLSSGSLVWWFPCGVSSVLRVV